MCSKIKAAIGYVPSALQGIMLGLVFWSICILRACVARICRNQLSKQEFVNTVSANVAVLTLPLINGHALLVQTGWCTHGVRLCLSLPMPDAASLYTCLFEGETTGCATFTWGLFDCKEGWLGETFIRIHLHRWLGDDVCVEVYSKSMPQFDINRPFVGKQGLN